MPHALTSFRLRRWAACIACGLTAIVCALPGCTTMGLENSTVWPTAKREPQQALRMTIVWTNGAEKAPGKPALRGFRARIRFYDTAEKKDAAKKDEPAQTAGQAPPMSMKVDGTITVYAFDETLGAKWGTSGSHKFVVTAAQLKKQHAETKLGHEYDLWFPWDKVGGAPLQIRLLVRFDPTKVGPALISENSRHLLPPDPNHPASGTITGKHAPADGPAAREFPGMPVEVQGGPAPGGLTNTPGANVRN